MREGFFYVFVFVPSCSRTVSSTVMEKAPAGTKINRIKAIWVILLKTVIFMLIYSMKRTKPTMIYVI